MLRDLNQDNWTSVSQFSKTRFIQMALSVQTDWCEFLFDKSPKNNSQKVRDNIWGLKEDLGFIQKYELSNCFELFKLLFLYCCFFPICKVRMYVCT